MQRYQVLRLLSIVICCNHKCIDKLFEEEGIVNGSMDLLFNYPWNNCMHVFVKEMVTTVLQGTNVSLQLKAVSNGVLDKIIAAFEKKNEKAGYMSFLIQISRLLEKLQTAETEAGEYMRKHEKWNEFVNGNLKKAKLLEDTPIPYGIDPKAQLVKPQLQQPPHREISMVDNDLDEPEEDSMSDEDQDILLKFPDELEPLYEERKEEPLESALTNGDLVEFDNVFSCDSIAKFNDEVISKAFTLCVD